MRARLLKVAVWATLAGALAGCTGEGERPPERLLDGSPARTLPVELEGIDAPAVLTRARLAVPSDLAAASATLSCLRERARALTPAGAAIERVGVSSESVTFRIAARASPGAVYACDRGAGSGEPGRRWCGSSYGELTGGRLHDPRLDLGCHGRQGEPLGFVWVEPAARTRYVAVEQAGYVEVYEPLGGLPVRISSSTDVDLAASRATFAVSEHDRSGRLVRRYRLEAVVAG